LELSGSGVINLELFGLDNLTYLGISKCRGIRDLSNLSRLVKLEDLDASDCIGINDVSVLSELYNLITVNLAGCTGIYVLPVLSGLTKLVFLGLSGCTGLRDVSTLLGLPNVNILNLSECTGLIALPDFRLCDSLVLLNLRGTRFIEGLDAYLIERATLDRTHESVAALMDAICVRKRASDFGGFVNDVRFSGLT
jgi:Leucine-rich repeat (LRR) protein